MSFFLNFGILLEVPANQRELLCGHFHTVFGRIEVRGRRGGQEGIRPIPEQGRELYRLFIFKRYILLYDEVPVFTSFKCSNYSDTVFCKKGGK